MKIITSALGLLTVLSVSILAQTSSATEPLLQIKRFSWSENVSSVPCDDCYALPRIAQDYRNSHSAGVGDFVAWVVLKNLSSKSIKSISLEFVFRDTATEREFLTYNFRFEQEIGRGKTKEIGHKIVRGKEPNNFQPAGPSYELLSRTRGCGDSPLLRDRKTEQFVRIRDNANLLKIYPCYFMLNVSRIECTDGSAWRP